MEKNWVALLQNQNQLEKVLETNQASEKFGLVLSEGEAGLILEEHRNTLQEQRRIEFGESIISRIIYEFCDSDYIDQTHYAETIIRLQQIFYQYKNDVMDQMTDDELLHFMKDQFEQVCYGDLDYLEGTCLSDLAQAIRLGTVDFRRSDRCENYSKSDDRKRWDSELYLETLKDLF